MPKITKQQVYDAVHIILSDEAHATTSLNYAWNYTNAVLEHNMDGKMLATQCLYILNNLSHWRHEKAKEVRAVLRQFAKENGQV